MTKVKKISKGDKFVCLHPRMPCVAIGKVIALTSDPSKMIGLEFDDPIGIHSCDNRGKDKHCIWVSPNDILTEEEYDELMKAKKSTAAVPVDYDEIILHK